MSLRTTAEVATEFRCSKEKVQDLARALGVGSNLGGSAGYRFSDSDVRAMLEALRPVTAPARRRRRAS